MSLISTRLVSPKFLLASSSCLAAAAEVAQRADAHLLQAIAAAHGELEVGHRDTEHLAHAVALFFRVFVVELFMRGLSILEEERRPLWSG